MSASVFYKQKICVCFQCCMCNLFSFKIFSWDEVTSVLVYLFCWLEHKRYYKLPKLTSSIYQLETNGGGEPAGGEHQQARNHHVCSAGSLRRLCRTGVALWLHQKIKCWSAQTVWRSYVVCSSFGNRWVTANLFFLPYPSVAFLLFGTKSYFLMMYGKGTRSSSGSCDFERWRHEIAVTAANFRLHFAQFSVWLTGTLSSLCALVSVCIASQHLSNRSWFHYHLQLSIWETEARLSARLTVCVRARAARVLTC